MGQPDQGHLEVDPGLGGVAHGHLRQPEHLHGPDQRGEAHPLGLGGQGLPLGTGHRHQVGSHHGQEALPEVVDQVSGELLGTESAPT